MSYNGWTNKETWLVNAWLGDNLAEMQHEGIYMTGDIVESLVVEWLESANGNSPECGLMVDLINCALASINYEEVARHYLD
jgi:hypothetical protein